ncbi:DUF6308 family protein [Micromonospora saelicesensis]|uniref:DUF6308 family protein n=1 Tax=Micromonospora saelicesensis TaxID=285676 RepID=UPI003D8AEC03
MRQPLTLGQILAVLDEPQSVADLRRYFGVAGQSPFTGGQFERLGSGGDRPETRNVITAEDLVAVELLSVRVPPRTALDLLQGALGKAVAAQLCEIPTDVPLGHPEASPYIERGGRADRAWRLLRDADGIGWVVAGKLLARKRPLLVPVYDEVVACAFRTRRNFWCWLHGRLSEQEAMLDSRLSELREQAGLPKEIITLLRVLDVAIWMRHRDEHTAYRCRGIRIPKPAASGRCAEACQIA